MLQAELKAEDLAAQKAALQNAEQRLQEQQELLEEGRSAAEERHRQGLQIQPSLTTVAEARMCSAYSVLLHAFIQKDIVESALVEHAFWVMRCCGAVPGICRKLQRRWKPSSSCGRHSGREFLGK